MSISSRILPIAASMMLVLGTVEAADTLPPAEVTNLRVTRAGPNVSLTWDPVTTNIDGAAQSPSGYRVYRDVSPDFLAEKNGGQNRIGEAAGATFLDAGAAAGGGLRYFYMVTAVGPGGTEGNVRPSKVTNPPAGLSSSFTTTGVTLTWTAAGPPGTVAGYEVFWGGGPHSYDSRRDVGNVTSVTISLDQPTPYYFSVYAYDAERNYSSRSNETSGQLASGGGPTEVCGQISTSTTWTTAGSPYIVTCSVQVWAPNSPYSFAPPPTPVLTIQPGVVVKFNAGTNLSVGSGANTGALNAVGTAGSPIIFTANQTFPTDGFWNGIYFDRGADPALTILDNAVVEYAGTVTGYGIATNQVAPTIRRTTVRGSLNDGIFVDRAPAPLIDRVTVDRVARNGVRVQSTPATITGSTIRNAGSYGVQFVSASSPTLTNNTIDHGVYYDTVGGTSTITGNTFERYGSFASRIGANEVGQFLTQNTILGETPASRLEVMGEPLTASATWPDPGFPIVVISSFVAVYGDTLSPVTLTLGAGLTIRFATGTYLQTGGSGNLGALIAQGADGNPITFTSDGAPGTWYGLYLVDGTLPSTIVDRCVVSNGGYGNTADIRVSGAAPTISNSTIQSSAYYGIYAYNGSSPAISNNTFSGNANYDVYVTQASDAVVEGNAFSNNAVFFGTGGRTHRVTGNTFANYNNAVRPVRVGAHAVGQLSTNTFTVAGVNSKIEIVGDVLPADATWPNLGFPYVVVSGDIGVYGNASANVTLTIASGVTIKSGSGTTILVGSGGNRGTLIAQGTPAAPILLTTSGAAPAPGQWTGVYFDSGTQAGSLMERCTVEYAGQSYSANVRIVNASPTIRNCTLRNSSVYGLYASGGSTGVTVQGSTFTGNANFDVYVSGASSASVTGNGFTSSAYFDTAGSTYVLTGNTFNGYNNAARNLRVGAHALGQLGTNTFNGTGANSLVEVLAETVSTDATWPNLGFPYEFVSGWTYVAKDSTAPATLTLAAGATLRFRSATGLQVGSGANKGALVAVGTVAQPITFTTANAAPAPGQWYGLWFDDGTVAATTVLERCVVEYAGQSYNNNIRIQNSGPTIKNSTIRNSSSYGIYAQTTPSPVIQSNTFSGNGNFDVYVAGANTATVTGNTFTSSAFFDTAASTYTVTGNTFNSYNNAARNLRVGVHVLPQIATNTFNGTGANSLVEVLAETVSTDVTWPNLGFPYEFVSGWTYIAKDTTTAATLTLTAGTTLRFRTTTGLAVANGTAKGALVAVGTLAQPITFTAASATPTPGQWYGLWFDDGTVAATTVLDRCVVEYAGQSYNNNIRIQNSGPTIRNSTIRNSSAYGIYAQTTPYPVIQSNTFSGNANFDVYITGSSTASVTGNTFGSSAYFDTATSTYAVTGNTFNNYNNAARNLRVGAHVVGQLGTNTFNGTGANSAVEVLGETLSADATWPALGFPYVLLGDVAVAKDASATATLTIAAGATLRFNSGVRLLVASGANKGALRAIGTIAQPIVFTTNNATPAPGQWQGIYFDSGADSAQSVIDRCTVEYAGQSYSAAIRLVSVSPPIRNSTIRNSSAYGIYGTGSGANTASPIITGNSFTGNANFDVYIAGASAAAISANTFTSALYFDTAGSTYAVTGNTFNNYNNPARSVRVGAHALGQIGTNVFNGTGASSALEVIGEVLAADATWPGLGFPYVIVSNVTVAKDLAGPSTLTIGAGATLKFNGSTGLFIGSADNRGALRAIGTVAQPILFTTSNATPAPGQWYGIYFDRAADGATSTLDRCTVEYAGQAYSANVRMVGASPAIRNSTIRNSSAYGLYGTTYSTTSSSPTVQSNTFSGNTNYDAFFDGGSAALTSNTFAHAARFDSVNGDPTLSNNTFNTYVAPYLLRLGARAIGPNLPSGNTFNGTDATSKVEIIADTISTDARWQRLSVPYVVLSGIVYVRGTYTVPAKLTIDPGVTVRMGAGTYFAIASGTQQGDLIAQGTVAQPILFTTDNATPAAGQWYGLYFDTGTAFSTALSYVTVEYAGQGSGWAGIWIYQADIPLSNCTVRNSGYYGIRVQDASPAITATTVQNTASYGFYIDASAARSPSLTGCTVTNPTGYGIYGTGNLSATITGCTVDRSIFFATATGQPVVQNNVLNFYDAFPLRIGADSIGLLTGNTFNGTGANSRIEILGESLGTDATWANLPVPYVVLDNQFVYVYKDAAAPATLTISPGTRIRFGTGTRLQIGSGGNRGALVAIGTDVSPIVFTSNAASPGPGNWRGIYFDSSTEDATTVLQYATVEYAGQLDNANIFVSNSSPTIRDCTIRNGSGNGISIVTGSPSVTFNTIQANGLWGISTGNTSFGTIRNNAFSGNTSGAVQQTTGEQADARLDWYGDASGPGGSGPGTGQGVSTNVVFEPWLGGTFTRLNHWTDAYETTNAFRPGSFTRLFGTLSQVSNWNVVFYNAGNTAVRTISGTGSSVQVDWDGKDDGNATLPDGSYTYRLNATSTPGGNAAATAVGRLTLKASLAVAEITNPIYDDAISQGTQLPIVGSAGGSGFLNYTLQYGTNTFPTSWTNIVANVATPVGNGTLGTWNTANLTNGNYTLRLLVNNATSEQTVVTIPVNVLAINSLAVDHSAFSPNGDGRIDTVTASATLSEVAGWTVDVVQVATSQVVKTYSGTGINVSVTWDGTRTGGTPAPEGQYRFDLTATKDGETVARSSSQTQLDITPPTATLTNPADGQTIWNVVGIIGTASDPNGPFQDYRLDYGIGPSPASWTQIGSTQTTPVNNGTLGNWQTNAIDGTEPIPNGGYRLRLTVSDRAGNVSYAYSQVSVDNLILGNVAPGAMLFNVFTTPAMPINFNINKPATVTLKIYPEGPGEAGPLQKQVTSSFGAPGAQALLWDGTNTGGQKVLDDAYIYILEGDAGSGRTARFAPAGGQAVGSGSGTIDTSYNPYTNDFWQMLYQLQTPPARVTMQVTPSGRPVFNVFTDEPHETSFDITWDGRDTTGAIVDVASDVYFPPPTTLRPNSIITLGNLPKTTGLDATPYYIALSYGQFSNLEYVLGQQARVTVKLLPPGIANPNDPSAIILQNGVLQEAGPHGLPFDGIDPADPNGNKFRVLAEGVYTFTVQAQNPVTGTVGLVRGVVNVYR